MANCVVALDSGTTSTRAVIFDHDGIAIGSAQIPHEQIFPQPGWVEHDAAELWRNASIVLDRVVTEAGLAPGDIAALGITNQRETAIVWNVVTGIPIANAIVWQDTRTQSRIDALEASGCGELFTFATGLPLATYFSATKFAEILDQTPGAREAASQGELRAGTVDSWLLWNLTGGLNGGVHATDVTNASRTLLMDIETLSWRADLCDLAEVPLDILPGIRPSGSIFGLVSMIDTYVGVPIAGIVGDQQAATLGHVATRPGEAKNTYGTGNFLMVATGNEIVRSAHGLLTTVAFQREGEPVHYALEGSIAVTGSLVQWLRDNIGIIDSSAEIEALAASVPDAGGVVVVPAFSGLFAPYWRADARGIIAGLTRFTTKAHIARAALESVAFQTRDVIRAAAADSGTPLSELRVDGGMVRNDLLMQMQADIAGIPVVRPVVTETTAMGAAFAAGLTVGFWVDEDELRAVWREDRRFEPTMSEPDRAHIIAEWDKGVERSLGWV
ncbi:MAG: glycerol kinase GlpK [Microbacteriaceae bacterium]|nr:glycerol kinase GlpK [Microbacteriaceae bacterium]